MAFVDFDDQLLSNGDLWLITHQRPKIRNILEYDFVDVPRIRFDVSTIIGKPLASNTVMSMLTSHLADFGVNNLEYTVELDLATGVIDISIRRDTQITEIGEWE